MVPANVRLLWLGGLLVLASATLSGQEGAPRRLPEPAADAQRESERVIRDLFKDEYSKRAPADQLALAKKLLLQGIETRDDPSSRYVLFREAREIAEKCGDLGTAIAAIAEAAKHYEIDGLALKARSLAALAAGAKSPEAASSFADACIGVIDEAIHEEKFEVARGLVSKVESAAKTAKDASRAAQAQKKGREIEDLARESRKAKEAAKTLEANPADPEASLALGRYLLMKGDVEKALALLAKGSDPLLRGAAERELAASVDSGKAVEAGDAWWEGVEKEKNETLRYALLVRAKESYEKGAAVLSGITKTKVEKRLAEIEGKMSGQKTVASPGPTSGAKGPLTLDLGGGVRMELVYVKPGIFMMGSTEAPTERWQGDERPPHRVEITRGFFLGKYEVTRGQFAAFVRATGYKTDAENIGEAWGRSTQGRWAKIAGLNWQNPGFAQTDDHPVTCVSWNDAKAFCEWMAGGTKREVRLPTEAEWEYACRAGSKTMWSFGDDRSAGGGYAWTDANSGFQTHPVGQKKPNAWGFHDMYGNVWEWCQDWLGSYASDARDPEGPASGDRRCLRGGGWNYHDCRSALRNGAGPTDRHTANGGFRVAVQ